MSNKKLSVFFWFIAVLPLVLICINSFVLKNQSWNLDYLNTITFILAIVSLVGSIISFFVSIRNRHRLISALSSIVFLISILVLFFGYIFSNFGF